MARTVSRAGAADREALKPEPPQDMWEKMAAAQKAIGCYSEPLPKNAFRLPEFMEAYELTISPARSRIARLIEAGYVRKLGVHGAHMYYEFTDAGQPEPRLNPRK